MQSNLMRAAPLELQVQTFNQEPGGDMLLRKTFAKQRQDKSAEIGVKKTICLQESSFEDSISNFYAYIFKTLGTNFRIVTQNEVYF